MGGGAIGKLTVESYPSLKKILSNTYASSASSANLPRVVPSSKTADRTVLRLGKKRQGQILVLIAGSSPF